MNKKAKFWLVILIISGVVWLGAINIRGIIGNDLLNYDEFSFRTAIPPDEENWIFKMLSQTSMIILGAYAVVLFSSIMFVAKAKINLRENPWFLMCIMLFYAFVPIEIFSSYLDVKFHLLYLKNPPVHDELLKIFGERIGLLKGVPWIALLSYYTILILSVYRPMKKTMRQLADERRALNEEYSYKYYLHDKDDLKQEYLK